MHYTWLGTKQKRNVYVDIITILLINLVSKVNVHTPLTGTTTFINRSNKVMLNIDFG